MALRKTDTPAMFSKIATRYDLLNHVLSLNIDKGWRKQLVRESVLPDRGCVVDVCTGTGDVAMEFAASANPSRTFGVDLSAEMLAVGRKKAVAKGLNGKIAFVESDALRLPFESDTFDAVTIAFGLRNLPDFGAGVAEMVRVLDKGGKLVILEFSPPSKGIYLKSYSFYLRRIVPVLGGLISGSSEAYDYLASSVRDFLRKDRVLELMKEAGLKNLKTRRLTGGIAYIYVGDK